MFRVGAILSIQVEFSLLPYPYSYFGCTTTPPPFPILDTYLIYTTVAGKSFVGGPHVKSATGYQNTDQYGHRGQ